MEFYKILEEIMAEKNMSIPDVARACNLPDSTVRSIIERKTKRINLEAAFKFSNGLNVSLARLNGNEDKLDEPDGSINALSEIESIFQQLTPDNRSKLLELALLYLGAQHKNEETE